MVLVFCLVSFLGSGTSLSLTYGSDRPLGSIGIRFLPSPTDGGGDKEEKEMTHLFIETPLNYTELSLYVE